MEDLVELRVLRESADRLAVQILIPVSDGDTALDVRDVMKSVAPEAASIPSWTWTKSRIAAVYKAANDDEAASAATGIGCEALTGQIKTMADLNKSLASALAGMNPNRLVGIQTATKQLQDELAGIKRDGTDNEKAAALWACYTLGLAL